MPKKIIFTISFLFLLSVSPAALAQPIIGNIESFNVQPSYDLSGRSEIEAVLVKNSLSAYWYVEKGWWNGLSTAERTEADRTFESLLAEFEVNIYPTITGTFGSEWSPGIDDDTKITILFHPMKQNSGGYNNSADGYPKLQLPESNEREMFYLNTDYIGKDLMKSFLAHELVHLVTFNQKEKTYGATEDVWLNEARAEYASTLMGYDDNYEGSNLQNRVNYFLSKPSDSLTEWRERSEDYGVANLFIQYLVDHYGIGILVDSLQMRKTGIESINAALLKRGFDEDFPQIFKDWTVAVIINDCDISEKYCYFNENLKDFRITPLVNYIPFVGESTLSVTNSTKDWAGNWHRFVGGEGTLGVDFSWVGAVASSELPYLLHYSDGRIALGELRFNGFQGGKITIPDFGSEVSSLTIIPTAKIKISGFGKLEPSRTFFWSASTIEKSGEEEPVIPNIISLPKPLSEMSSSEKNQIAGQLEEFLASLQGTSGECTINQDLYFGMDDNEQVRCLQEFLKSRGQDIYPEGLVTGNFYTLTEQAVTRFQNKYASEILSPWGLTQGTGFVGSTTRAKINELLSL